MSPIVMSRLFFWFRYREGRKEETNFERVEDGSPAACIKSAWIPLLDRVLSSHESYKKGEEESVLPLIIVSLVYSQATMFYPKGYEEGCFTIREFCCAWRSVEGKKVEWPTTSTFRERGRQGNRHRKEQLPEVNESEYGNIEAGGNEIALQGE